MRVPRRLLATLVAVAATLSLAVVLGACGGSSGSSGSGEACPATVSATVNAGEGGALRFSPDTLTLKAGTAVIKLVDKSSINHTFQIHSVDGIAAVNGSVTSRCGTFKLTKGTYTFYCGVSGHEAAGMKGTLTVTP